MKQNYSKERALLVRFNKGISSPEENLSVDRAFNEFAKSAPEDLSDFDAGELRSRIWGKVLSSTGRTTPVRKRLWARIAIAATVATFVLGAGLFYFSNRSEKAVPSDAYMNDVHPGKQGATLTLANGQKILIKDALTGNIASQNGVKISKTATGEIIYELTDAKSETLQYNTLSTSIGEQTQVRLPDGSLVFLNAASSLEYPTSFAKAKIRSVTLTGEGYFEIAKDKAHPFIVKTNQQEVRVLGTHFNVNSYRDEFLTRTTLLEGSIRVSAGNHVRIIKPGEQSMLRDNGLTVKQVNIESVVAWKNKTFKFEDEKIGDIMRILSRWYDIDVIYEGTPTDESFVGEISRNKNISQVLKMLEKTGLVHFRIQGKKITVISQYNQ